MPEMLVDERPSMETAAAAPYCGYKASSFKTLRSLGKGPPYYRMGKRVMYRRADLDAWIESRRVDPQPNQPAS